MTRLFFCLVIIFGLLTLAKDLPPYRIYLLDLVFLPCFTMTLFLKMGMPGRFRFKWQRIDKLMLGLLTTVILAFTFSESPAQSVVTFFDWLRVIAMYFTARMLFSSMIEAKTLQRLFTFGAGLLLVIGLIQLVTNTSFGLVGNYFGSGTEQGVAANVEGVGSRARISGTTSNPIIFAMWVTLYTLVVAAHYNAKRRTLLFFGVSAVGAVIVLATLSRGAIAAFGLTWLIFVFIHRREFVRNAVAGVVMLVLLLPTVFLGLQESLIGQVAEMVEARIERQELLEEDSGRVQVFKMGMSLLSNGKIFMVGTGPDNMVLAYNRYSDDVTFRNYETTGYQRSGVHNVWMKMFVEYGVAAALIFIMIWYETLRHALRLRRKGRYETEARIWSGIAIAFFIPYLLIDSMVYESAMSYHLLIPMFVLIAFVVSRSELGVAPGPAVGVPPRTLATAGGQAQAPRRY